jgi:hypothetical protein
MVVEGALSKIYKLVGDNDKAVVSFSLYSKLRTQLYTTEARESMGR